jgi:regulator of protease activity HflC (stomatin/prohibitin superfamily)
MVYNRFGGLKDTSTLKEGLNFVIPWFQRPIIYDIRTRPQLINTQSGSKDLQMVQISLRVLFKPNPRESPFIYRRLGRGKWHIFSPKLSITLCFYNASIKISLDFNFRL